jgi:hypothetical protein
VRLRIDSGYVRVRAGHGWGKLGVGSRDGLTLSMDRAGPVRSETTEESQTRRDNSIGLIGTVVEEDVA